MIFFSFGRFNGLDKVTQLAAELEILSCKHCLPSQACSDDLSPRGGDGGLRGGQTRRGGRRRLLLLSCLFSPLPLPSLSFPCFHIAQAGLELATQ